MLSNAYFLAKFRFDTAENEPAKDLQKTNCKIGKIMLASNLRRCVEYDGSVALGLRAHRGLHHPRAHPALHERPAESHLGGISDRGGGDFEY